MQRSYNNIFNLDEVMEFKSANLKNVRHALDSMSDNLKSGLGYRSARTKYHREVFEALASAMRVKSVRGYQKYDEFVLHRLHRSYNMISSAEVKYGNVLKRLTELNDSHQLEKEGLRAAEERDRSEKLLAIQDFGEFGLVRIIAPYYLSNIVRHMMDDQGHVSKLSYTLIFIGMFALSHYTWTSARKSQDGKHGAGSESLPLGVRLWRRLNK